MSNVHRTGGTGGVDRTEGVEGVDAGGAGPAAPDASQAASAGAGAKSRRPRSTGLGQSMLEDRLASRLDGRAAAGAASPSLEELANNPEAARIAFDQLMFASTPESAAAGTEAFRQALGRGLDAADALTAGFEALRLAPGGSGLEGHVGIRGARAEELTFVATGSPEAERLEAAAARIGDRLRAEDTFFGWAERVGGWRPPRAEIARDFYRKHGAEIAADPAGGRLAAARAVIGTLPRAALAEDLESFEQFSAMLPPADRPALARAIMERAGLTPAAAVRQAILQSNTEAPIAVYDDVIRRGGSIGDAIAEVNDRSVGRGTTSDGAARWARSAGLLAGADDERYEARHRVAGARVFAETDLATAIRAVHGRDFDAAERAIREHHGRVTGGAPWADEALSVLRGLPPGSVPAGTLERVIAAAPRDRQGEFTDAARAAYAPGP